VRTTTQPQEGQSSPILGPYGLRAQEHWKQFLPHRYANLQDPAEFFSQLGEEIEDAIAVRERELAPGPPGPDFLANYARLSTARMEAEGQVLREMLPPPEDDRP
jgi:hypothetical protein